MADTKVVVALGSSVYDNKLTQKKVTVDFLFEKFNKPKIRIKKDGPYFIFASFKENKRNAHNLKYYYGATLDLDDTPLTPNKIKKVLKDLNCRYALYTTHSHQDIENDKGNRYRIVVPYIEPVSKSMHVDTTLYLKFLFGLDAGKDMSDKALSRPMYLPACPRSRKHLYYFYDNKNKNLLNPEKKIELPAHVKWEMEELNRKDAEKVDITAELTEGGRNDHIAKMTGTLIQQGKTLQEIVDFCEEVNQLKFSPPMRTSEVITTVKSVWQSHTRNHGDKDWSYKQLLHRIKSTSTIEEDLNHLLESTAISLDRGKTTNLEADKLLAEIKKKDKSVTLSSLRSELRAKRRSAESDKKKSKESLNLDQDLNSPVVDKIRREYKEFYFVASQNVVYNRKYSLTYKLEGFNNKHSSLKQDFGYTQMSPFRILDEVGAIGKVDAVKYHPGKKKMYKDSTGMVCLNTYNPSDVKPIEGSITRMIKHFAYLFPDEFERNVMLDYIAFNYQFPGEKLMWCPVIKGQKGIGKSILSNEILSPLFGMHNVRNLNNSQPLLEKFNSWQTDSQIVVIHELFVSNRLDVKQLVTENIKSFITDKFLLVRKMHTDGFQTENVTNMIAFTNHEDSLYVTPDERRFCMIKCEVTPRSEKYYARLVSFLTKHQEDIAYFFKNREIKTISPHSLPVTNYTREVMNASLNWAESIFTDSLEDKESPFVLNDIMTWTSICHAVLCQMSERGDNPRAYENVFNGASACGRQLRQALIENGFKQYGMRSSLSASRVRVNGRLENCWMTPSGVRNRVQLKRILLIKRKLEHCAKVLGASYQEHIL